MSTMFLFVFVISNHRTSKKSCHVLDLSKLDALLHKIHSKVFLVLRVPRLNMCRSIISLSKITRQCGVTTHSVKETIQKKVWGWTKFEKVELAIKGGIHKTDTVRYPLSTIL